MADGYVQVFTPIDLGESLGETITTNRDYDSWWRWGSTTSGGYSEFTPASVDAVPALARLYPGVLSASMFNRPNLGVVENVEDTGANTATATAYVVDSSTGPQLPRVITFTATFDPEYESLPPAPGVQWGPPESNEWGPDGQTFIESQVPGGDFIMTDLAVVSEGGSPPLAGFWTQFRQAGEII
jgi:hypothetical protein